jgi:hypothetical protein
VTAWAADELRRAALGALGAHADERAHDALVHGSLTIATAAARWEASAGAVEAHRVTLALDAGRLGGLRGAPAVIDAVCAAVATAIAARPGEVLHEIELRWEPGVRAAPAGYRDAPPPSPVDVLRDAVVAYLDACGEVDLARVVASAQITANAADPSDVSIHLAPVERDALRSHPHALGALTRAVRDLLADAGAQVRVRLRP